MSVAVGAKALYEALRRCMGAVENRNIYPILACVRIEAAGGSLKITATDLDVQVCTTVDAEGEQEAFLVDAQRLSAVLDTLKGRGELTLSAASDETEIRAGRARFLLPTLPVDGFPELKADGLSDPAIVAGAALSAALSAVAICSNDDQAKPHINGVRLEPGDIDDPKALGRLIAVATNGARMAAWHLDAPGVIQGTPGVTIPTKSALLVAGLAKGVDEVALRVSARMIWLSFSRTELLSKLNERPYPDWRRAFPARPSTHSFNAGRLWLALSTAASTTAIEKGTRAVRLKFSDEETTVSAQSKDGSASGFDVCPHSVIGEKPSEEVGVSAKYLQELVRLLDCETVELSAGNGVEALIVRPSPHTNRRAVVMPVRV